MIRPFRRAALVTLFLGVPLLAAGCTFVSLDPAAEEVEVLSAARTADCDRVGQTRVTTAHRVGFIPRGAPAIERDLDRLARNSALDLGGDTVVRKTEIEEGKATYDVFDCVR